MQQYSSLLQCSVQQADQQKCYLTISVPAPFVDSIYGEASRMQQAHAEIYGFSKGGAPLTYIQEHYKNALLSHVQEFLFKFFVINYLYDTLHEKKLCTVSEPRLNSVIVEPRHDAHFVFEFAIIEPVELREWKHFVFKGPKRKNYKDIDRQVDSFIKDEQESAKLFEKGCVHTGDWVCFEIGLLSQENQPLLNGALKEGWIKIGSEEADMPFQHLFLGKRKGESFSSNDMCLQEYFSHNLETSYLFSLTIKDIVHHSYFCFESFKHHFKLKTNKEVHQKLIEIFSYRNDISLRRSIIDEALHLLITKHQLSAPKHLVSLQQKIVLDTVQHNPDYYVYKTEENFKNIVSQLAARQVTEMILIDQIAQQEHLQINESDMRGYLTVLQRPRTKEFVHFIPPSSKIEGQEIPLPSSLLKRNCLREKTLNHVIYYLTKN